MTEWWGLFGDLSEGVSVKVRRRGASDCEALVASLAFGNGALSDLDALRDLGLHHPPCRSA